MTTRPLVAVSLSAVGGFLTLALGLMLTNAGIELLLTRSADLIFGQTAGLQLARDEQVIVNWGIVDSAAGLLILVGAAALYFHPERKRKSSIGVVVLSVIGWFGYALVSSIQGFYPVFLGLSVGPFLALVGGLVGLVWHPAG